jgi:hypothetical protein
MVLRRPNPQALRLLQHLELPALQLQPRPLKTAKQSDTCQTLRLPSR